MYLIDTHCHLSGMTDDQVKVVISSAKNCGVLQMICIGASDGIASVHQALKIAEGFDNVWATVGIHPHDAGEHRDLDQIIDLVDHERVVAIGETGLDFYRDWAPVNRQHELFRASIAVALKHQKPLVIHCRDAAEDTIAVLEETNAKKVGGVFHCYAEDAEFAARLREINFLVSVTGNITFKKADTLRQTIKDVPLEQIMVETDTPYMAPEPFRGKPSEPMHVYQVARTIADVKGISLEKVAEQTSANARKLFGLPMPDSVSSDWLAAD